MTKGDRDNGVASCDDGYTMIPNLMLEALTTADLSAVQIKICLFIYRRTSGWNCVDDAIPLVDIAVACKANLTHVTRQVNSLIKKNIIRRVSCQSGKVSEYTIVNDITTWDQNCFDLEALTRNAIQGIYSNNKIRNQRRHSSVKVNYLPALDQPEPYSYTKTLNGVLTGPIYFCESQQYQLSELLANKIIEHTPYFKRPDLQKWAKQMDVILDINQRPPEEIKAVILFSQSDLFWKNKIHSVITLRKQYEQLNSRRLQARTSPTINKYPTTYPKVKKASKFESFYIE